MKNLSHFLAVLFFASFTNITAQTSYYDGHNQFSKIGGAWYVVDSLNTPLYDVDPNRIIVKFNTNVSATQKSSLYSVTNTSVIGTNSLGHSYLSVQSTDDVVQITQQYNNSGLCEFVELNTIGKYHVIPNDFFFISDQVNLDQTSDVDIDAPEAWDIETGNSNVTVAILDNGTNWNHPDLGMGTDTYQNIYLNNAENDWLDPTDPSTGNNIDDDGNGYVDDWKGYHFSGNNNDSKDDGGGFIYWHGTAVAGIVGAKTNNNIGIAGIAGGWNNQGTSMMILKLGLLMPQKMGLILFK
jgi:serine protease